MPVKRNTEGTENWMILLIADRGIQDIHAP